MQGLKRSCIPSPDPEYGLLRLSDRMVCFKMKGFTVMRGLHDHVFLFGTQRGIKNDFRAGPRLRRTKKSLF